MDSADSADCAERHPLIKDCLHRRTSGMCADILPQGINEKPGGCEGALLQTSVVQVSSLIGRMGLVYHLPSFS